MPRKMSVIIEKSDNLYLARAIEVDVLSQGKTIPEALERITEAINLFLEKAKPKKREIFLAQVEVGK